MPKTTKQNSSGEMEDKRRGTARRDAKLVVRLLEKQGDQNKAGQFSVAGVRAANRPKRGHRAAAEKGDTQNVGVDALESH